MKREGGKTIHHLPVPQFVATESVLLVPIGADRFQLVAA